MSEKPISPLRQRMIEDMMVSTITLFDGMAIAEFDVHPASASHGL